MADYTEQQLIGALRKADAAGDVPAAKAIARRIQSMRQAAPDFSNVQTSVSTRQEGWQPGAARSTMLGARDVIEGAGGLLGMLGGDAVNQYVLNPASKALGMGEQTVPYREAASRLADTIGLPKPSTAGERVLSDVGQGLTGTALTMGAGSLMSGGGHIAQRAGDLLTAQPRLQAISAATGSGAAGVTRESGGGQGAQLLAGLAGGLTPGAAATGTAATLRGMVRGRSGEQMQRTIEDFNRLGASPSVGQASGRWGAQGAESLLAGGPTSAGVMTRFAERQAEDIGSGLQRMADDLSRNASAERAGRAIERGVDTFQGNVGAQRRALYWAADRQIPSNTATPMSSTLTTLRDLTTPNPGAAETTARMVNPRLRQMLGDLEADLQSGGGAISYEALRRIRTSIGEQMNDFSMTQDTPAKQLSALYAALSRDMEAAARTVGPDAVQAARRANNYTRLSSNRLQELQRVIDRNGGPERVFQAAMSGTKDGGTTLRAVMQSLPADGQRAVTAAVIKRMGMANPGMQDAAGENFSAATFLTNWNKVSPEAKRALFDRHGPQFSRQMDQIARVAQNIKEGSKIYANPSGTANRAAAMTYGASLVGSLFTGGTGWLLAGGLVGNGMARALTNPRAVRWLANMTVVPRGSIPAALNSMRAEAEKTGDQDLLELADELEQRVQESANADNHEQR